MENKQTTRSRVKGNVVMPVTDLVQRERPSVKGTRMQEVTRFSSLSDTIAQDRLFYKNHYFTGGKEAFPLNEKLQRVSKYYPYAKGGPIYVDEVTRLDDQTIFEEKQQLMKRLGHRYVILKDGTTELEAREQLA